MTHTRPACAVVVAVTLALGLAACGPSPDVARPCADSPPGLTLVQGSTRSEARLHQALAEGCIPTSYDPEFAGEVAQIRAALDGWRSPCSDLCFQAPVVSATPRSGERRVHFAPESPQVPSGNGSVVQYGDSTGRIVQVIIVPGPRLPREEFRKALARGVGRALGFTTAPAGADSVMLLNGARETPSPSDLADVCALYGRPPWCERP